MKHAHHTTIENAMMCLGLQFEREFRFEPKRRWRADWYIPAHKILLEYEGSTWGGYGRHVRGVGYGKDCEKYNHAQILGYKVLRFTSDMVVSGLMEKQLQEAVA